MSQNTDLKVLHIINELGMGGAEMLLMESLPIYKERKLPVDLLLLLERENCKYTKETREKKDSKIFVLGYKSLYTPLLIFKIIPYLKKYDVVHVHLFPSLYWVALAKMISFSKTKLIFTEHSTSNNRMKSKFYAVFDKIIYKAYSKIITISQEVDLQAKKHLGFKFSKFELIHNGVNLKNITNAKAYSKTDFFQDAEAKIVLQVSNFREPKDQQTLIKSMVLLPENVKLLLVGHGVTLEKCEELAKELKIENRVKFLGLRRDVLRLLKTADVIVLSSKYEGLSLSSIEGMGSGKPFIASQVPGLTEVVENAGLLFPQGDEKALATHIEKLIANESFYNEISKSCLERSKHYEIERMVNSQIELYKKLSNK